MELKVKNKQRALTLTPPMGWNSFDSYGCAATEQDLFDNLEIMAARLKSFGYEYFVLDNGWFAEYEVEPGQKYPKASHADEVRVDEYGRYLPSVLNFPNGMQPVIDRTHELGLKFGIHIMRGISRKSVALNLPIYGTPYRAADIANTSDTCKWCHYNYGVDMDKPGAQAFYNSWVNLLASWGVDFIKADDITGFPREIDALVNAIAQCGRDIVLSLSPGGQTALERMETYKQTNMLRTTTDIWDNRNDIGRAFDKWKEFNAIRMEGFWLDMDMIPFGHLCVWRPVDAQGKEGIVAELLSGKGSERMSGLTRNQKLTFITMRALAASPLFMGGALPTTDEFSFELITNPDMIACNQNGNMGELVFKQEGIEVWVSYKRGSETEGWLGIFNRTEEEQAIRLDRAALLPSTRSNTCTLRNIWNEPEMSSDWTTIQTVIGPDGVLFLEFNGSEG